MMVAASVCFMLPEGETRKAAEREAEVAMQKRNGKLARERNGFGRKRERAARTEAP